MNEEIKVVSVSQPENLRAVVARDQNQNVGDDTGVLSGCLAEICSFLVFIRVVCAV